MKRTSYLLPLITLAFFGCSTSELEQPEKSGTSFIRTIESTEVTAEETRIERFSLYSPSMDREIKVIVVLPPAYDVDEKTDFPILYTLHGGNAPYDTYAQMSKLRAQLKDKPFIYTCFDADASSMYIDSFYPIKTARRDDNDESLKKSLFTTFFFDEFVPAIDSWYRTNPHKRGVTGFSMGGSGSFHYMLEKPDFFNSVSVLSSGFVDTVTPSPERRGRLDNKLGDQKTYPERYQAIDHYLRIAQLAKEGKSLPPIYSHCGTEDFFLKQNQRMNAFLKEHGYTIEYHETEGAHNWKFWHPASVGIAAFHWKHFTEANN